MFQVTKSGYSSSLEDLGDDLLPAPNLRGRLEKNELLELLLLAAELALVLRLGVLLVVLGIELLDAEEGLGASSLLIAAGL